MKLVHPIFDTPIVFKENMVNVLVIENKRELANMIYELIDCSDGIKGRYVLSEDNNELAMGCVDVLTDVFRLNINNKKNITKLVAALEKVAMEEQYYEKTCRITGILNEYVLDVIDGVEYNIDVSDVKMADVFKLCNVRFNFGSDGICGVLSDYMQVMSNICGVQLFVFVELKRVLSKEDMGALYKTIFYNKYNIHAIFFTL